MDSLAYQAPDYSGEYPGGSDKKRKMKTVHPTMRLHKTVPKFLMDAPMSKEFKVQAIIEVVGKSIDKEYGDGREEVTVAIKSIEKIASTTKTKKEYLESSAEEREEHNRSSVGLG